MNMKKFVNVVLFTVVFIATLVVVRYIPFMHLVAGMGIATAWYLVFEVIKVKS